MACVTLFRDDRVDVSKVRLAASRIDPSANQLLRTRWGDFRHACSRSRRGLLFLRSQRVRRFICEGCSLGQPLVSFPAPARPVDVDFITGERIHLGESDVIWASPKTRCSPWAVLHRGPRCSLSRWWRSCFPGAPHVLLPRSRHANWRLYPACVCGAQEVESLAEPTAPSVSRGSHRRRAPSFRVGEGGSA